MSLNLPGGNSYVECLSSPISDVPFTMAIRHKPGSFSSADPMMGIFSSASTSNWADISVSDPASIFCGARGTGGTSNAVSGTAPVVDVWQSVVAVFASNTSRTIYNNGETPVEATTDISMSGFDKVAFGRYRDSTPSGSFVGKVCDAAIWNVALTAAECQAYIDGASPWSIRPGALVAHWPFRGSELGSDLTSSLRELTDTGGTPTLDNEDNPVRGLILPPYPVVHAHRIVISIAEEEKVEILPIRNKAALLQWKIDRALKKLYVRINGGAYTEYTYSGNPVDVQGDLYVGVKITDGSAAGTGSNFYLSDLCLFDEALDGPSNDILQRDLAARVIPTVPNVDVFAPLGGTTQVNLFEQALDPSGEGLEIVSVTAPSLGSVAIVDANLGIVSINTAGLSDGNSSSFKFRVSNKFFKRTAVTATCSFTTRQSAPPVAKSDSTSLLANSSVTIDVLGNDENQASNVENLNIVAVGSPTNGTAELVGRKIKYTPETGYVGSDSFTYTIANENDITSEATVTITVNDPPTSTGILKEYRVIGDPTGFMTQANTIDKRGWFYKFSAPMTGVLRHYMWYNQGVRQNYQQGDTHSHGTCGSYWVRVYELDASDDLILTDYAASTNEKYYPGIQLGEGGFDVNNPGDPPIGNSTPEFKGGLHVLAWGNLGNNIPPSNYGDATWRSVRRFWGSSKVYVDLYAGDGSDKSLSFTTEKGKGYAVCNINDDNDPTQNYTLNNDGHGPGQGVASRGITTAFDSRLSSWNWDNKNQDRRKVPYFFLGYDDGNGGIIWLGNPYHYLVRSGWKDTGGSSTGCWFHIFGNRGLRQVMTPPSDYVAEDLEFLFIHAFQWTGLSNYTGNGSLRVRIKSRNIYDSEGNLNTGNFSQIWPDSGWHTFGSTTFKKVTPSIGGTSIDRAITNLTSRTAVNHNEIEAYLATSAANGTSGANGFNPGIATLPDEFKFESTKQYTIEVSATSGCCYIVQPTFHPDFWFNSSRLIDDNNKPNMPQIWHTGDSGQTYNRVEETDDISRSEPSWYKWNSGSTYGICPFSLVPKND